MWKEKRKYKSWKLTFEIETFWETKITNELINYEFWFYSLFSEIDFSWTYQLYYGTYHLSLKRDVKKENRISS